jgi:integrase/recombinase XerD
MNRTVKPELQGNAKIEIVESLQIICHKCGSNNYRKHHITKAGNQKYYCCDCKTRFIQFPQNKILEKSDDIWLPEELGLRIPPHRKASGNKFNFRGIEQQWLKDIIKSFIKYKASIGLSFGRLSCNLNAFKDFSTFLISLDGINSIEDIDRKCIIKYLEYNNKAQISSATKSSRISSLSALFETGVVNKWFVLDPYLIQKCDYPKQDKFLPRYIPEDVLYQLNQHIEILPESVMRMVMVIQECGLRIGELCQLPLNCLKQDSKGGWFIQFMRSKMKFETTIPISIELAQAIKEQHKYIQQNLDKDFPYLFCARKLGGFGGFIPVSNVMSSMSFVNYIKRLGDKFDICDSTGKRWNFQTHQFRHTVGTRMINNGVPQHIIQRYLGHETPEMTSRYAYIHDSTLRKALDRYLGTKVVDINGEVIQSIAPELDNNSELQWLKKKVLAETLSNGYCGLPAQLTCSKGNACLTCSDFRTTIEYLDQHKQHLERTNQVLEVAQSNGWERQIQVNQDVKNSLEKIITTLEGSANA